jgi:Leucine-rich repeat (LRR) protein
MDAITDSTFASLKKLRVLDLRNNNLRQLQQSALAAPPALQEVYLSGKWTLTQSFQ